MLKILNSSNENKLIYYFKRNFSKNIEKSKWKSVVGLEVHAQIATKSKLFSGAATNFVSPVNTNVSIFDCAIPGTLPVLNRKCVEYGVLTALALNCNINPVSWFDRKHYFYADLPAGYQITQQRCPLAINGNLEFQVYTPGIHKKPYKSKVRIKQLQLEQDSGKSLHDVDHSLVDLNRAGVPLMELVFEPDLKDGEEAAALVKELISILHRIKTCSCKMEEGALRVDANVSIHRPGEPLGIRTEIKNIGSVRGVAGAVKYEIERQIKIKEKGGEIVNETRSWDAIHKVTVAMRDKEEQQDYRYMPEPNLPPLHVAVGLISEGCVNADELKKAIPELPEETRQRLQENLGLSLEQSIILVNDNALLNFFENVMEFGKFPGKMLTNILLNDFATILHKADLEFGDIEIDFKNFAEILKLFQEKTISRHTMKLLFKEIINGNTKNPRDIVIENNWKQISDEKELMQLCEAVLSDNPKLLEQYKRGKTKVVKVLLGIIVERSQQRADMEKCTKILQELLDKK